MGDTTTKTNFAEALIAVSGEFRRYEEVLNKNDRVALNELSQESPITIRYRATVVGFDEISRIFATCETAALSYTLKSIGIQPLTKIWLRQHVIPAWNELTWVQPKSWFVFPAHLNRAA